MKGLISDVMFFLKLDIYSVVVLSSSHNYYHIRGGVMIKMGVGVQRHALSWMWLHFEETLYVSVVFYLFNVWTICTKGSHLVCLWIVYLKTWLATLVEFTVEHIYGFHHSVGGV